MGGEQHRTAVKVLSHTKHKPFDMHASWASAIKAANAEAHVGSRMVSALVAEETGLEVAQIQRQPLF